MSDELGLFDVPDDAYVLPPEPENLSASEKRRRRIAKRISTGEHPLGYPVMLHDEASRNPQDQESGPRCGMCRFRVRVEYHNRVYAKCFYPDIEKYPHPRDSHSDSSDIRAWWPACRQFEREL